MIARGAEAVITREGGEVHKDRVAKRYRLAAIDEALRSRRTRLEAKLLSEARRCGVSTPLVFAAEKSKITMEHIEGGRVKELLDEANCGKIAAAIGAAAAKLHAADIVHGDLTTSNMIIRSGEKRVKEKHLADSQALQHSDLYLIDFGLGFFSRRGEDKAVDMHLLREALESTHHLLAERIWQMVLKNYSANYDGAAGVLRALQSIEKRGRYVKRTDAGRRN